MEEEDLVKRARALAIDPAGDSPTSPEYVPVEESAR
jgi:hypothetical protein